MRLLHLIDRFSFKKLISVSLLTTILVVLPLTVWLVQQETKISGRAAVEIPPPTPTPTFGPQPKQPPTIHRIWPFLGKPGDAIFITGENFGDNPPQKALFLNERQFPQERIISWQNEQIQAILPNDAQAGLVKVGVGGWENVWDLPLTVYSKTTQAQGYWQRERLVVKNVAGLKKVVFWFEGREREEKEFLPSVTVGDQGIELSEKRGPKLLWLTLYDATGQIIPFFVDPLEFGF